MIQEAMSRMSNLVIKGYSGLRVILRLCERPTKPVNWPSAVVCFEEDVRIVKCLRHIKQLFRDLLSAGELTPSGTKQPQPCQGRR